MIRMPLSIAVVWLALLSVLRPIGAEAVVSTNVGFTTVSMERRSVEARPRHDTTGLTKRQLERLEAIKEADRIRNLPMAEIAALGNPSNPMVLPDEAEAPGPREGPEEDDTGISFQVSWELVLLAGLVLAVLGILFSGNRRK